MDLSNIIAKIQQNKKIIIIAVAVVILFEVVWAVFSLTRTSGDTEVSGGSSLLQTTKKDGASVSLNAGKKIIKVGETLEVSIDELSKSPTDGTDVIIFYDPKLLSVIPDQASKLPVSVGTLYNDYPLNSLDEQNGQISVSGITAKVGGTVPNGRFGSVVFKAKSSGQAKVIIDFKPGSTTDSNVIETKVSKDILTKVDNLELEIKP